MAKINPVLPVLGVAGIGGFLYLQQTGKIEELKAKLSTMGGGGGGGGAVDLSFLGDVFSNLPSVSSDFDLQSAFNKLISPVSDAVDSAKTGLNDAVGGAVDKVKGAVTDGLDAVNDAVDKAKQGFDNALTRLETLPSNTIKNAKNELLPDFSGAKNTFSVGVTGGAIGTVIGGIMTAVTGTLAPIVGLGVAGFGSAWAGDRLRNATFERFKNTPEGIIGDAFVGVRNKVLVSTGLAETYNDFMTGSGRFGNAGTRRPAGIGSSGFSASPVNAPLGQSVLPASGSPLPMSIGVTPPKMFVDFVPKPKGFSVMPK